MKKRIAMLLFVILVLSPFAFMSQNVQADRQLPANQSDMGMVYVGLEAAHDSARAAPSDPTQSETGNLTLALAAFSALALMALYALVLTVGGSRSNA